MRFESAQFKLSHEMTQLLDPSGSMKSAQWQRFVRYDPNYLIVWKKRHPAKSILLVFDTVLPNFLYPCRVLNQNKNKNKKLSANVTIWICRRLYFPKV